MLRRVLMCSVMLVACGKPHQEEVSNTASIIEQNTMVEIEKDTPLPNLALKHDFAAIGRMTGGCTAFHLGHGIVATAGHCVSSIGARPTETSCHTIDILWGVMADGPSSGRSRCLQVLDMKYDQQADYALLQVDPVPATAVALQSDPQVMSFNPETIVVGYPKGKALSLSGTCEGTQAMSDGSKIFHHRCDTLPGNSGSPVMDAYTSQVIGVHNGDADNQENYGTYLPAPENMLSFTEAAEVETPLPTRAAFGPFPDQLKKNLLNVTTRQASAVSFQLQVNVEDGYDKLIIVDGAGRVREHTGSVTVNYNKLPTPVSVVVLTDYSGTSQSVVLDQIHAD